MFARVLRWAALFCASLLLMGGAQAFAKGQFAPGSACFMADAAQIGFEVLASRPDRWTCDRTQWSIAADRTILRFDMRGAPLPANAAFVTSLTIFKSLRITAIGLDGKSASKLVTRGDVSINGYARLISTPLPRIGEPPEIVYIEIDKPRHERLLTKARIAAQPPDGSAIRPIELIVAALCGLLIIPFVYNLAFYRVLRERFLLWHAVATVCLLVQTLTSSGLLGHFIPLSVTAISIIVALSWSAAISAAGMFIVNLVEPGKLDPWHSRVAQGLAAWTLGCGLFYLAADGPMRDWAAPVYFAGFVPVIMFFALIMFVAARRGSRAIRFQIAALSPMMIVGTLRALTLDDGIDLRMLQYLAIALEVVITSLGVADRFLAIKRQRDAAMAETHNLEWQAERDALTGLLNRRALSERFDDLHQAGFETIALLDLDHFKRVNDDFGHAVGDDVLRSVATALMPDDDTLAVRMGGEEFLLLLRGGGAVERAERRRQAITARVAADIPGLNMPVTASMGLVEQPHRARMKDNFVALYAHCDRLLYEAKRTGRNRTMREKIVRFDVQPNKDALRATG
jgi:diguanylate cyclase (GGDEF)-like protein